MNRTNLNRYGVWKTLHRSNRALYNPTSSLRSAVVVWSSFSPAGPCQLPTNHNTTYQYMNNSRKQSHCMLPLPNELMMMMIVTPGSKTRLVLPRRALLVGVVVVVSRNRRCIPQYYYWLEKESIAMQWVATCSLSWVWNFSVGFVDCERV